MHRRNTSGMDLNRAASGHESIHKMMTIEGLVPHEAAIEDD